MMSIIYFSRVRQAKTVRRHFENVIKEERNKGDVILDR